MIHPTSATNLTGGPVVDRRRERCWLHSAPTANSKACDAERDGHGLDMMTISSLKSCTTTSLTCEPCGTARKHLGVAPLPSTVSGKPDTGAANDIGGAIDPSTSTWAPLRSPVYRALWIAQLVSNLGTWMQTVGAQWMLVGDPRAAILVPLVQTATTLPVMLLALPSGVLADLIDRRRLLIATQGAMAAGVGLLATLTGAGLTTPAVLLTLLFVIGCGQALTAPAWQAIQPDLVPAEQIPAAAALGSMSINGARAIGPAIAGVLVSLSGPTLVFALNAVSFVGIVFVLDLVAPTRRRAGLPARAGAGGAERGRTVHPQLADRAAHPAAGGVVHRPGERDLGAAAGDRGGPTRVVVVGVRGAAGRARRGCGARRVPVVPAAGTVRPERLADGRARRASRWPPRCWRWCPTSSIVLLAPWSLAARPGCCRCRRSTPRCN